MKRFLADACLILILVSIGSYVNQKKDENPAQMVEQKVQELEDEVAQNKVVHPQSKPVALKDIEENRASQLAKKSSELIVDTISGTVGIVSDLFAGILR